MREGEIAYRCWFTAQVTAVVRAGPAWSLELLLDPREEGRRPWLGPSSIAFPRPSAGSSLGATALSQHHHGGPCCDMRVMERPPGGQSSGTPKPCLALRLAAGRVGHSHACAGPQRGSHSGLICGGLSACPRSACQGLQHPCCPVEF